MVDCILYYNFIFKSCNRCAFFFLQIRGLPHHAFGKGIDVEKGDVTQLPGGSTEGDISPHDDSVLVASEQPVMRAKRGSGKTGLFQKVFDRRHAEPSFVGYRNKVHELSETTPLRREYVVVFFFLIVIYILVGLHRPFPGENATIIQCNTISFISNIQQKIF